jgi:hypothetical protein
MVKVLEKVGLSDEGLKLQEAPEGRPLVHDRVTGCVEPLSKLAVMVFDPELPCVTVIPPLLDNEKSKEDGALTTNVN